MSVWLPTVIKSFTVTEEIAVGQFVLIYTIESCLS